jgi:uncharacterized protein (DUF2164 family)
VRQHKSGVGSEFTKRYHITRLVYYLIRERNPQWVDLAADWFVDEASAKLAPVARSTRDFWLRSE